MKFLLTSLFAFSLLVSVSELNCMQPKQDKSGSNSCPDRIPKFLLKDPKIYDKATQDYLKSKGCTQDNSKRKK